MLSLIAAAPAVGAAAVPDFCARRDRACATDVKRAPVCEHTAAA